MPLKDSSGNIVTDPLEQAGILNAHYATVYKECDGPPGS